ncbi:MAG: hypothetical protein EHM93_08705 [Bacteroidales bacterium]|nr:MAG: hypothetical protein EHM93_08705 [Bacteroidales bacterium]
MTTFYRKLLLLLLVSIITISGFAQNFIGQHKQYIRQNVKQAYPGFNFDKEVNNGKKSFLKYVNTLEEQTLLFILDENGICTSTARMYNSWLFSKIKGELDKKYKRKDSLTWYDSINGNVYEIFIKKGNWFFTVITRPKK